MKIYKTDYEVFGLMFVPFYTILSLIYFYMTSAVSNGMSAHWVLLIFLIAAIVNPKYSKTIRLYRNSNKKLSLAQWLSSIILFQLCLYIFFRGISDVLVTTPLTPHFLDELFPWDLYAAFSITFGYTLASTTKKGLLSSTVSRWFHNSFNDGVGTMSNSYARANTMTCLSLTLSCATLFALKFMPVKLGVFNLAMFASAGLLVFAASTDHYRKVMRFLVRLLPLTIVAGLMMIFAMGSIIAINTFITHFLGDANTQIVLFDPAKTMQYNTLMKYILLCSWSLMAPSFIVHLSQGYSVRAMLLVQMIVPLIFFVSGYHLSPHTTQLLALISCVLLLLLFLRQKTLTSVVRATLPTEKNVKHRAPFAYMNTLVGMTLVIVSFYLITGPVMLGYVPFMMTIPGTLLTLLL